MKAQNDDMNFESMITKLSKGSISEKAASIKKLLFLHQNARSRIYLYERRIVESLQLSLLIEEKEVSLNALSLLEKILINAATESEISNIFRKKLLSKVILNLGSVDVNVRRVSHKCIHEYIRKFRDYETIVSSYLKNAIKPNDNTIKHLKLKSINSFQSLLMAEPKHFVHSTEYSLNLIQELIASAFQKEFTEIRRAALICLLCVLRINGSELTLRMITSKCQSELYQLSLESDELSALLALIMKYKSQRVENSESEDTDNNAPSPKFISIQESEVLVNSKEHPEIDHFIEKIPDAQIKVFNEVSYAEEFLKKLESSIEYKIEEIKGFAPYLEKYLVDESIKLFSISKKIVEVIFDTNGKKQFYVVLVPCVINGIGNKRFIVRKNLDKLVRQYAKNHTQVWIENYVERFSVTKNSKLKDMLIDLFIYSYKLSPEFSYPTQRPFQVFDVEIANKNSNLKWKVIDCVVLMLERQGSQSQLDDLLKSFSLDSYNKILRKINKNSFQIQIASESKNLNIQDIELLSPTISNKHKRKFRRNRLVTDQPEKMESLEKDDNVSDKNVSEEKKFNLKGGFFRQKRSRKSHIEYDINLNGRRKKQRISRESFKEKERNSVEKLPELYSKHSAHQSLSKQNHSESPVKKSFTEKNIMYIERQQLHTLQDPKLELERALLTIKSHSSWMSEFDSINKIRCVIEHNSSIIGEEYVSWIINQLLNCFNNLRSGVMKISLICLDELIRKMNRKLYPFTETILTCILKKSVSTSEFIAEELKKCICICVQELCISKIISVLQNLKEGKNVEIKMNSLLIIETMVRVEKIYKKQTEWIWITLIEIHGEPQFQLRLECKRVVKLILELYKSSWKKDVISFKKFNLEKIDKILKNINQKGQNSWIEHQNHEFQKIIFSKGISSKFFTTQFSKFEDIDKQHLLKKNWKERIKNINDTFNLAFEYPEEFESNLNAKKYLLVLCEHLDEKNPGLMVNGIHLLNRCIETFEESFLDIIGLVCEKYIIVLDTKRIQLISMYQKLMQKIYRAFDLNRVLKEFIKISVNSTSLRTKSESLNQMAILLRDEDNSMAPKRQEKPSSIRVKNKENSYKEILVQGNSGKINFVCSQTPNASTSQINVQNSLNSMHSENENAVLLQPLDLERKYNQTSLNMLVKMVNKLLGEKMCENSNIMNQKIRDLVVLCDRKFGEEFTNKISANDKLMDFLGK